MTTHFISQTEITLDKYLYWANHPIGKNARKKLRTHNIICVFGIIFSLIGGIFCLKNGAFDFGIIYLAFFCCFCLESPFSAHQSQQKTVCGYNQSTGRRRMDTLHYICRQYSGGRQQLCNHFQIFRFQKSY